MRKHLTFILLLIIAATSTVTAQELNIDVKVTAPINPTADPKLFETLERSVAELFNNTKWTDDEVASEERINGTVRITIVEEKSTNSFVADIIVQSERPVFQAVYVTPMLNYIDKSLNFNYDLNQPIQRSDNVYLDQLSSVLTFYAYAILALDYDSFSSLGGDEHWQSAQNVINAIPSGLTNGTGWDSGATTVRRNRYWLVENMLNPKVRPYRQSFYDYHIKGLDTMYEDADKGRAIMLAAVNVYGEVNSNYNNSMVMRLMADTKRDEVIEIFQVGDKGQKAKVRSTMLKIDPTQADRYNILK